MPTALFTARALIEEPAGDADVLVGAWEVSEDLGSAARGFSLTAGQLGQLQVGNHVAIVAGYDADRVTLMRGRVSTTDATTTPNGTQFSVAGEDAFVVEILRTPVTFVWEAQPPGVLPRAHTIVREAAAQVGVTVGALAFPDYPLYTSYVAHQRRLLDIVQDLAEPWNLFAAIQHVPIIREGVLSVLRVEWANPPATGYVVPRSRHGQQQVGQQAYDDEPRLTGVIGLEVHGAAYPQPRVNLGVERRYNYVNRRVDRELLESVAGTYGDFVWMEIYTLEEREGGKVTRTEEQHYQTTLDAETGVPSSTNLVKRIETTYDYYLPLQAIQEVVAFPVSSDALRDALLWATVETREELDDVTQVFGPAQRTFKQYFYNDDGEQIAEQESVQEFDTDAGQWRPAKVVVRTHSQTTSSTVRTQISSYIVEPDNNNALTTDFVDSQQVGGQLPTANSQFSRDEVSSVQVQVPALAVINGVPTEQARSSNTWVYENPHLGPAEAQQVYDLAVQEQARQLTPVRWETVSFESTLDPNLWVGQPIQLEVADGAFESYWVQSVRHRFDVNGARTTGVGRRLTQDTVLDPTVVTVVAPSNLIATVISTTQIDLTWTDNATNETSYRVEQSLNQVTWTEIATLPPNSSSYSVTGLTPGTTYYFRVRAFAL